MIITDGEFYDLGGGFKVRHLLPLKQKRLIGPFIFLDHMGPLEMTPTSESDVRPHPHIGLSTLTYLCQGRMVHKDSLGNDQIIRPGEVNWMTSGDGVVHSERFHKDDRGHQVKMEGLQFWVALPDGAEDQKPSFQHYGQESLPRLKREGVEVTVVVGEALGQKSPVKASSPMIFLDVVATKNTTFEFEPKDAQFEIASYVLKGEVVIEEEILRQGHLALLNSSSRFTFEAQEGSRFIIIGGEAFKTTRHIYWNFVASTKEKIEDAKKRWLEMKFPLIPDDDEEFTPLGE